MAIPRQRSTMMVVSREKLFSIPTWLDEDEFKAIFLENYAKVYAILFRLTGDRFAADDLTAETFWRLWERPPAQPSNLAGWLYRVASNLGYNLLRANHRRKRYEEQVGLDAFPAQDRANPPREVELAAEREQVRHVLSKLPRRDAQVIVLRHSGLTYKEIAGVIHVAPASIGTLLARAEERFLHLYQRGDQDAS